MSRAVLGRLLVCMHYKIAHLVKGRTYVEGISITATFRSWRICHQPRARCPTGNCGPSTAKHTKRGVTESGMQGNAGVPGQIALDRSKPGWLVNSGFLYLPTHHHSTDLRLALP